MLIAILTGGCVCIPSHERRINDLEGAIADMKVDTLHITPSLARLLKPEKLPLLETVRLGGEAMAEIDTSMWQGRVNLFNSYGPSECGVTCVMNLDVKNNPANIGRGVAANTWVVDPQDHTRLVPIGATGELLIEGPTVGQGYWNDLEKTKAAFVESPSWLVSGTTGCPGRSGRLYKTGDIVRYESDGTIVFLGRKDNQVKLHGQRIELGEIEYHLRRIFSRADRFVDTAVEIVTPAGGEPKIVAFVALAGTGKKPAELQHALNDMVVEVQAKVREALSSYMIPFAYVAIPRIPLNSSSKVDRKQLQQIDISIIRGEVEEEKRAPVTVKERTLQGL
jgi:acyl-coenzyme A synthetase/AMP-(fatty) acid ligase